MNRRLILILLAAAGAGLIVSFFLARPKPPSGPMVAVVLDDWGNNRSDLELLYRIKSPVTLAVLPDLKYSKEVALDARKHGYQVILHLPLESQGNRSPESDTLYCFMTRDEIKSSLGSLLDAVPGISGVNNHQGSRGTEDPVMMGIILREVKRRKLFFLDSRTTGKSVCSKVAGSLGMRIARRDVFLDIPSRPVAPDSLRGYIRSRLEEAAAVAREKGFAVAIGHDKKITLSVLQETMPALEKEGIRFVPLSRIVEKSQ